MDQAPRLAMTFWPWKTKSEATESGNILVAAHTELLVAVIAALPDPGLLLDPAGIVLAANDKARELLGFNPNGQHLSAAIRSPAVLDALAQSTRTAAPAQVDYELRGPTPRHFEAVISPIIETGTIRAILVMLRDLTREQRIERLRADFVANASHELRTPLASLSGFIETLQGPAKADEAARDKFLSLMQSQAQRMKRLIDDLLSLSRIEMSEHVPPSAVVDLSKVAQHVADVMAPIARDNGAEIKLMVRPGVAVTGEWDELVQVTQNLVENAIKYASAGKLIEISTSGSDGHAELSVRDHGPGIAEEHVPRLTERFYRVSVQDSRARGGTGLGLAIVKHILNRHRGRMIVRSELGKGSTFTIRLPARN
jgi:two-component system phosphate regulon sensor histidine kinase PhoR